MVHELLKIRQLLPYLIIQGSMLIKETEMIILDVCGLMYI